MGAIFTQLPVPNIKQVVRTFTVNELRNCGTTPIRIINAPGVKKYINVISVVVVSKYVSQYYNNGSLYTVINFNQIYINFGVLDGAVIGGAPNDFYEIGYINYAQGFSTLDNEAVFIQSDFDSIGVGNNIVTAYVQYTINNSYL